MYYEVLITLIGIYKITNLINDKKYIGQSNDIERRFKEHHSDPFQKSKPSYNCIFYQAIRKYGIKNFSFEILELCKIEELDNKEKYWIKYYNTYIGWENCQGYNMTIGGSGARKFDPQEIIKLWNQGNTIEEIINILDSSYTTITNYLHQEGLAYVKIDERKTLLSPCHSVLQYSLEGIFLNCYNSVSDAVREIKPYYPHAATANICKACKYKITTAYNFIWKYIEDETPVSLLVEKAKQKIHHRNRSVNQYDLQGNFIQTFSTLKEAATSCGLKSISAITNVCTGRARTSGGFMWSYSE